LDIYQGALTERAGGQRNSGGVLGKIEKQVVEKAEKFKSLAKDAFKINKNRRGR